MSTASIRYMPAAACAAKAIAAHPEKSNRTIAAEIGVSERTVHRARELHDVVAADRRDEVRS